MDEHIVGFGHFMRFVVNKEIMEQHQLYHLTFSLPSSSSLSTNKRKDSIWVSLWHVDHNLGLCCWSSFLYNRSTGEHWRNLQLHLLLQQLCGDRGAVWWTPQCVDHRLQWQLHHEQGARRSCSDWYVRCFISFIVPEMMWYHRCSVIVSCLISPSLQFPAPPPIYQCQSTAAKILRDLTGLRASVLYSTLLLLRMQMETCTAVIQWAPTAWWKTWDVDRITLPALSAPI